MAQRASGAEAWSQASNTVLKAGGTQLLWTLCSHGLALWSSSAAHKRSRQGRARAQVAERDGSLAALRGQIAGLFEQFGGGRLSPGGLLERLRGLGVEVRCSQEQLEASLRRITAPGCARPPARHQLLQACGRSGRGGALPAGAAGDNAEAHYGAGVRPPACLRLKGADGILGIGGVAASRCACADAPCPASGRHMHCCLLEPGPSNWQGAPGSASRQAMGSCVQQNGRQACEATYCFWHRW